MKLENYKITRTEDDDIKPEETLMDTLSHHPTIEAPIGREVFNWFYTLLFLILAFLFLKSFQLQVINGEKYVELAQRNIFSKYFLSGLRGGIYDDRGRPMVENVPVFDLVAVHGYLPVKNEELVGVILSVASILKANGDDVAKIFEKNKNQALFVIKKALNKEEVVKTQNLSLSGIFVIANAQRRYIGGAATAHLIGYTSAVTKSELQGDEYYLPSDRVGRLGLESQYEYELRGRHRSVDFNKKGDNTLNYNENDTGNDLVLNINNDAQTRLYQAMKSVFDSSGVRRGGAIAQNAKTGAVLGLVSMPSFDSNIFENPNEQSGRINQILNSKEKPLLDRVVGGKYSPGSTVKPLLAMAGLKEGVVTPSTLINAEGSIQVKSEVDPNVVYTFRDWKVHGWTDIKKAIADSVDVYFYALGGGYGDIKGLGIDRIEKYLKNMRADKITGIDLPGEVSGFVPSADWKKSTKGESWYLGDTYNISIGQGDLSATPIWLNAYAGSIANGGKIMKPYVVKEIRTHGGDLIKTFNPEVLASIPFDQRTIEIVKQGMRRTVLDGTAKILQDVPVALAAKTGTAQVTGRGLNSLFMVFGPYEDPEIVMTVLVENINQSQGLAMRVARDFLLWYFSLPH